MQVLYALLFVVLATARDVAADDCMNLCDLDCGPLHKCKTSFRGCKCELNIGAVCGIIIAICAVYGVCSYVKKKKDTDNDQQAPETTSRRQEGFEP